mmetsp:Transcript_43099/g.131252  ORF Transcript_43099/g.131252 Transcript_43099/m.131252 type:complete len:217 (+) Transcript_43099:699-1349(+)
MRSITFHLVRARSVETRTSEVHTATLRPKSLHSIMTSRTLSTKGESKPCKSPMSTCQNRTFSSASSMPMSLNNEEDATSDSSHVPAAMAADGTKSSAAASQPKTWWNWDTLSSTSLSDFSRRSSSPTSCFVIAPIQYFIVTVSSPIVPSLSNTIISGAEEKDVSQRLSPSSPTPCTAARKDGGKRSALDADDEYDRARPTALFSRTVKQEGTCDCV